jgi:predicted DNA-binding transcriptional regulator YafY
MNRVDRLLALILHLQSRRVVTAEELAGHFELSVRTVYRDLNALGEAGVPIVAEAGVGYSLLRGYHLPPVMFTAAEAAALATGGVLVAEMTDASVSGSMQSALRKIRAVLPREEQDRIERIGSGTLLLEPKPKTPDAPHRVPLMEIQDALARRRVIRLAYRAGSSREHTQRDVEPLGLAHYLQHWHLIAWCRLRQDFRDFRTDRIESATVLTETFAPRENFDLQDHVLRMEDREPGVTIRIRIGDRGANRVRREWSLGLVTEEPTPDGVVFTLTAGRLEWFVNWLLSFGPWVTVLDPPGLRDQIVAAAEAAAAHHRGPPPVS